MKKLATIVLALLGTGLGLTYALWDVNFSQLLGLLSGGTYVALAPFLAAVALFFWLTALRWVVILEPLGRFSWMQVTPAMMIGFGGNNLFPAHLGELARAMVLGRQFNLPVSSVLVTLVLERILDVVAILLIYFASVAFLSPFPASFGLGASVITWLLAGACLAICVFLWKPELVFALWARGSRWLPSKVREQGFALLKNSRLALSSLKSPGPLVLLLGFSLLKWLCAAVMVWISLWAFGTSLSAGISMVVVPVTALAITVPSAPGYVGVIQAAFVFALVPFGVSREVAFAASVFYLVAQWVPVTALGVIGFLTTGLRVADVRDEMEKAEREGAAPWNPSANSRR